MPTPREQKIISKLESMTIDEARQAIASAQFGHNRSPDREFASAWLDAKEATLRDAHDAEMLSIARESLTINASTKKRWYEKPLGILWLSIVASLLVGLLFYTYSRPSP
jgi:hypothetical protein